MNVHESDCRRAIGRRWVAAAAFVIAAIMAVPASAPAKQRKVKTNHAVREAAWGDNVDITLSKRKFRYQSNGIPNHSLEDEYIMPDFGPVEWALEPTPEHSHIEPASQAIQPRTLDKTIPTRPKKVKEKTGVTAGALGVMISGAPVYNPYEGDGTTVAMASNFSLTNAQGKQVYFVDDCTGHPAPTPLNQYHYHGYPECVASQVDEPKGPSHIIGVAYDGFPIYGNRDIDGKKVKSKQLDRCNGIKSPTPEFTKGIYHYVLTEFATVQSTIRCLHGKVDESLLTLPRHGQRRQTNLTGAGGTSICGLPTKIRRY